MKLDKLTRDSLAPYLPIPHGGRRVLISVILALVAIAMIASWWVALPFITQFGLLVPLVGALLLAWQIIMSFRDQEFGGDATKWFKAFVDRNLLGHELWCVRDLYGDPTVSYEIHRRGADELWPNRRKVMIIAVPFRKGAECRVGIPDFSRSWWRMRTHDTTIGQDAVKMIVEMRDWNGNRFSIDVRQALRILVSERSSLVDDRLTESVGSIGRLVEGLMDRLDAAKSDLTTERSQRDMAVGDVDEAVAMIKDTARFGRSKQGGEIRTWLEEKLVGHLTFRDIPRRKRDAA